jgi:KipI family sensor histidine kinase inhibitor
MGEAPEVRWVSDQCLRIALGGGISPVVSRRVRAAVGALRAVALPALLDVTAAYTTVLLTFDLARLQPEFVERRAREALSVLGDVEEAPDRVVEIPVCYGGEFGPDLDAVAAHCGIQPAEVVAIHSGASYTVEFLGFSPGFPYLSGLPARLATPRLERPRVRVPAGSVGIAGPQTGVYPQATPGGWRLIGRTPLRLFDAFRDPPALLVMGDTVRFTPIGPEEFDERGRG